MKVMAPSSGGFRSFALPKKDPPVNLTTLAKELPSKALPLIRSYSKYHATSSSWI